MARATYAAHDSVSDRAWKIRINHARCAHPGCAFAADLYSVQEEAAFALKIRSRLPWRRAIA